MINMNKQVEVNPGPKNLAPTQNSCFYAHIFIPEI